MLGISYHMPRIQFTSSIFVYWVVNISLSFLYVMSPHIFLNPHFLIIAFICLKTINMLVFTCVSETRKQSSLPDL